MSRNFDLMHDMERYHEVLPIQTVNPTIHLPKVEELAYQQPVPGNDGSMRLVQQVLSPEAHDAPRMVVFAGIEHGNGCTHTAVSVARILAGSGGRSVCLVDANFRSPAMAGIFRANNDHGLSDALSRDGLIQSFVTPVHNTDRLWLMSAGSLATESPNLMSSRRLMARCAELREEFDVVVVDAPPLAHYADAIALGRLSDGVVMVIEAESTRKESALAAVENLRSSDVKVLGAVLNKRVYPIPEKLYSKL
jgi:capsular exopolysaccharide synthesis family protein